MQTHEGAAAQARRGIAAVTAVALTTETTRAKTMVMITAVAATISAAGLAPPAVSDHHTCRRLHTPPLSRISRTTPPEMRCAGFVLATLLPFVVLRGFGFETSCLSFACALLCFACALRVTLLACLVFECTRQLWSVLSAAGAELKDIRLIHDKTTGK